MRRLAALILLLAGLLGARAAWAEEYIDSYHADIALAKDGTLTVTETIRVHAEGDRIRRGIYRDFPLTAVDDKGREGQVDFTILAVERDGRPEPYHTEGERRGVRIYFGAADVLLPSGFHEYRLTYETGRQIRFFDGHDELFWNVTGTQWAFPIRRASATVTLPAGVRAGELVAFTGAYGATGRDARAENRGGTAHFVATRPLDAYEGLTVGVKMPAGSIDRPSAAQTRFWWLRDNRDALIGLGGLAAVLGWYVFSWRAVGRDPPAGVLVPRWDPPDGISPALVNYIDGRGFAGEGWTAVSASLLNLAVKGLVELEDLKRSIVVLRTEKAAPAALPTGEAELLKALPAPGDRLVIDKAHGSRVQKIGAAFRAAMEKEHRRKYYLANWPQILGGLALSAAVFFALIVFGSLDEESVAIVVVPVIASIFVAIFSVALGRNLRNARSLGARILAVVLAAFAGFVAMSVFGGFLLAVLADGFLSSRLPLLMAVGGIVAANLVFLFLMGAPTPLGRRMMDGIAGLKQYLTLAEKERMNMMGAPEMSPAHYERLLPYAVALGVEKPWSEAFERWLAAAVAAGAAAAWQPAWYHGEDFSSGNLSDRMGGFAGSMADTLSSSLPPPSSSSSSGFSSGGGFSGGGGGGGGGGGW